MTSVLVKTYDVSQRLQTAESPHKNIDYKSNDMLADCENNQFRSSSHGKNRRRPLSNINLPPRGQKSGQNPLFLPKAQKNQKKMSINLES